MWSCSIPISAYKLCDVIQALLTELRKKIRKSMSITLTLLSVLSDFCELPTAEEDARQACTMPFLETSVHANFRGNFVNRSDDP